MRPPIVSGTFYPSDFGELDRSIKESFEGKLGPGTLPSTKRDKHIFGVITPHAGYKFSGQAAAWGFKEIAESEFPQIYILLGNDHSGIGEDSVSTEDWQTPFGTIKTEENFAKKLIDNITLHENNKAHYEEHSIEVQLPFLQFVNKAELRNIRIVSIMISTTNYKAIAERIHNIITETRKKVCIICSSDFMHYGISYSYVPFKDNVKENMYNLDKEAIKFIEKLDAQSFLMHVREHRQTICGSKNIAVMIDLCKSLGSKSARLLRYYTSGDITQDYSSAVGYAAVLFE